MKNLKQEELNAFFTLQNDIYNKTRDIISGFNRHIYNNKKYKKWSNKLENFDLEFISLNKRNEHLIRVISIDTESEKSQSIILPYTLYNSNTTNEDFIKYIEYKEKLRKQRIIYLKVLENQIKNAKNTDDLKVLNDKIYKVARNIGTDKREVF